MAAIKGIRIDFDHTGTDDKKIEEKLLSVYSYTDAILFELSEELNCLPEIACRLDENDDKTLYAVIPVTSDMDENEKKINLVAKNGGYYRKVIVGHNDLSSGRCGTSDLEACIRYVSQLTITMKGFYIEQVMIAETYSSFMSTPILSKVYEIMLNYYPSSPALSPEEAATEALEQRLMIQNITQDEVSFGELGALDTEEKTFAYMALLSAYEENGRPGIPLLFIPERFARGVMDALTVYRERAAELRPFAAKNNAKGIGIYYWLPSEEYTSDHEFKVYGKLCGTVFGYSRFQFGVAIYECKNNNWRPYSLGAIIPFDEYGLWRVRTARFYSDQDPEAVAAVLLEKGHFAGMPVSFEEAKAVAADYVVYDLSISDG